MLSFLSFHQYLLNQYSFLRIYFRKTFDWVGLIYIFCEFINLDPISNFFVTFDSYLDIFWSFFISSFLIKTCVSYFLIWIIIFTITASAGLLYTSFFFEMLSFIYYLCMFDSLIIFESLTFAFIIFFDGPLIQ